MSEWENQVTEAVEPARKTGLKAWLQPVRQRTSSVWGQVKPGPGSWKGAGWGMLAVLGIAVLWQVYSAMWVPQPNLWDLLVFALLVAASAFAGWGIISLVQGLSHLPKFFAWAFFSAAVMLFFSMMGLPPLGAVLVILAALAIGALVGGSLGAWLRDRQARPSPLYRIASGIGLAAGLVLLGLGLYWLVQPGTQDDLLEPAGAPSLVRPLDLPDPSLPGTFSVKTLTYGSGKDLHRPEYTSDASLITASVDGSAFLEGWKGLTGSLRTKYWGFDAKNLPLNARVWYPDGPGPFPLVLIVHGNHSMEDYSDPGYAYLGELLASRGYLAASVDENFLNGAVTDILGGPSGGLGEENDARGWLLLEHLKAWRAWNADPSNPFYGKVDLQRVALIGHSRGGEAVAVAAAFNTLPNYPDNAKVAFDYNFGIRAVAAIAPIDGQYRPGEQSTPLEDVDYFILHGSYDGDVRSMVGLRQYDRLEFSGDPFRFKAGLYAGQANHGQFNTSWGRVDNPGLMRWLMNLRPLLPAADQEQIAKVYLSAFLEAALRDQTGYLPLFRDARAGAAWLPETAYLNQYVDSTFRPVSTFDEDLDVQSITLPGGSAAGERLSTWREQWVGLKWGTRETGAVYLGWDNDKASETPLYRITLPESGLQTGLGSTLVFSMADARRAPTGKDAGDAQTRLTDLTIELVDRSGNRASLPLSAFSSLYPQIPAQVMKAGILSSTAPSEPIYQLFQFPLADFQTANPQFAPSQLAEIRFIFNRTPKGEVILDQVGFEG